MEIKDAISEWVDAHEEELLRDISRLVAIRSVMGEPAEDAPFGEGPRRALDEALALCGEYGFKTDIYGGAIGTADINDLPSGLDILGHLDVVDEGDGWSTDPYTAERKDDGCLYGRGTDDDKGPVVMALYAMRCIRELGIPLGSGCRLIMGTNEENGSADLPYYYNTHAPAPRTFTPDSGFPVFNAEKGRYAPEFGRVFKGRKYKGVPRVTEFHAGFRVNVIPGEATAKVVGMSDKEILDACRVKADRYGVELKVKDGVITVYGKQAHAASPWEGKNALTALLGIVNILPLAPSSSSRSIHTLAKYFPHGDWHGRILGIAQSDIITGDLTVSFTQLDINEEGFTGRFDARVPLCATEENCRKVVENVFRNNSIEFRGEQTPPHYTPGSGEFVRTLLRCYKTYTGRDGSCVSTGGGTYVHDIPGGVAFGATMPGFNSNLHGANERINIQDTLTATKIFALAIAELCGKEDANG